MTLKIEEQFWVKILTQKCFARQFSTIFISSRKFRTDKLWGNFWLEKWFRLQLDTKSDFGLDLTQKPILASIWLKLCRKMIMTKNAPRKMHSAPEITFRLDISIRKKKKNESFPIRPYFSKFRSKISKITELSSKTTKNFDFIPNISALIKKRLSQISPLNF